jgi:hypothetical protein
MQRKKKKDVFTEGALRAENYIRKIVYFKKGGQRRQSDSMK